MTALIAITLVLVAVVGAVVVLTPDPERQSVTFAVFGLTLVTLFMCLQAPDVALSELAVGSALVPIMLMLTIRKLGRGK